MLPLTLADWHCWQLLVSCLVLWTLQTVRRGPDGSVCGRGQSQSPDGGPASTSQPCSVLRLGTGLAVAAGLRALVCTE